MGRGKVGQLPAEKPDNEVLFYPKVNGELLNNLDLSNEVS